MKFSIATISLLAILIYVSGCVSYEPNSKPLLYGYYIIEGDSMLPILEAPTAVLVKPVPYDNIEAGDIVVFKYRNRLIVHRAVKKVSGVWLTQGDNLKKRDSMKVTRTSYQGLVYSERNQPNKGDIKGALYAEDVPVDDR